MLLLTPDASQGHRSVGARHVARPVDPGGSIGAPARSPGVSGPRVPV